MVEWLFKALRVDVLLLEDDALDPGGVALGEEECEVVRDEVAVAPRPRLFLMGEETLLQKISCIYFTFTHISTLYMMKNLYQLK